MDTPNISSKNEKIQRIISLLTFILQIEDREIMILAIENVLEMLRELDINNDV
jgi:hypothetical protein